MGAGMLSPLDWQATTISLARAAARACREQARVLAERNGISTKTGWKWRSHGRRHGPHRLQAAPTRLREAAPRVQRHSSVRPSGGLLSVARTFRDPDAARPGQDRCMRTTDAGLRGSGALQGTPSVARRPDRSAIPARPNTLIRRSNTGQAIAPASTGAHERTCERHASGRTSLTMPSPMPWRRGSTRRSCGHRSGVFPLNTGVIPARRCTSREARPADIDFRWSSCVPRIIMPIWRPWMQDFACSRSTRSIIWSSARPTNPFTPRVFPTGRCAGVMSC